MQLELFGLSAYSRLLSEKINFSPFMKHASILLISFTLILSCSRADKSEPIREPINKLVGTNWKWVDRQENSREVYSKIKFKDGVELEVSSNDNAEGIEKVNQVYKYSYNETSKTITYALNERPFCEGVISGDSMKVTCGLQRVFKRVL